MERVYSVFGKPQPEHFPSGGLELPEALKEAQVNPPSGQGGLKISPLFPGHPANVFGSDARLPPEFRPMPEPPGGHFIVRKKQGDNIIHVGRAVAAQNPFPEFFPGEHLEYGVIACGPGFRFPVARRNGLGAAQPVVVEFFRGEGDAAAAGDGPGNVKCVFSAGEGRRQADFQGGGTAGEEPPEQFAPDDAGDPVFQKEPEYFSFLRKDAVAGGEKGQYS